MVPDSSRINKVNTLPSGPANEELAEPLERMADLLEQQDASPFRVTAYRRAARMVRSAERPLVDILDEEGREGLEKLPSIGPRISSLIAELVNTGRLTALERLEGSVSPEDLLSSVPGIGDQLAHDIHVRLGVETLEELEVAAHDGRLETVPRIGKRRTEGIRQSLAGRLSRSGRKRARLRRWQQSQGAGPDREEEPPVELVLDVDRDYRKRAGEGKLRMIAPRRFNPDEEAWLPVMHSDRKGWSFTAMFSNTAKAHELDKTRDWVVIYFDQDGQEDQRTVVTETSGTLKGKRVIRGREDECASFYRKQT